MAITYRGAVQSYIQYGRNALLQNLFTIENGVASRVNMNIRRFAIQNDATAVYTAVMPIVRTSRAINISGGLILPKTSDLDTIQNSDNNVKFRAGGIDGASITATKGDTIWQQFIPRMHTAVEQQQADDKNLLPMLVSMSGKEFKLRPGENLLVQVSSAVVAANAQTTHNFFAECIWEEDPLSTFTIGGTVKLSGDPVDGAKVIVVEASDTSLTNAILVEVITTGVSGTWSSTIRTGYVGGAFVQYKNGTTLYTAAGSPFLQST